MQSFTRVLPPVRRVAVAGGTHGNEMSGVCLARHWLGSGRAELQRPHIEVEPFLANTRAVERCVRYIDADLNRMFTDKNLRQPKTENLLYEVWRAQQINETYGPIGSESAYDMLLDMHNTTSNMGISLVLTSSSDHLSLHMAQFLQRKLHPIPCNAVLVEHPTLAYFHLRQVAKHALSIEIGPQPQGVARADITEHMRRSIAYCLDFMHKFNSGMELPASKLDVHRIDGYIDYPRDSEGHITAIIHPAFQVFAL
uniref:Aspartoacylase n=1 Tax=Eptatretus burgeri TaxID=7764 RepID=A0A8C4QET0_EPTBU